MNGRMAKSIRRAVYGDGSTRQKRAYVVTHQSQRPVLGAFSITGMGTKIPVMGVSQTIANHPDTPRAQYRAIKREYARRKIA